jgi:enoyl-CoA hydratase/carnithine racemase
MFGLRLFGKISARTLTTSSPLVQVERIAATGGKGHIALLRLNNPKQLNNMDIPLGEAFLEQMTAESAAPGLRACVITGAGRAFSAGGDLDFLEDRPNHSEFVNRQTMHTFYSRFLSLRDCPVPVIAAVQVRA